MIYREKQVHEGRHTDESGRKRVDERKKEAEQ